MYSMTTLDKTFTFTQKITTKKDYDEKMNHGVAYMPRQARKKSGTGIYHVMLRGINR